MKFYVLCDGGNSRVDGEEDGSVNISSRAAGHKTKFRAVPGSSPGKWFAMFAGLSCITPFLEGTPLPTVVGATKVVKPPTLAEINETRDAALAAGVKYGEEEILEVVVSYFLECVS